MRKRVFMGSHLYRLLKNSLGVLRRAQDERGSFDIIDDFPFMLRLSKHSEPFSTACLPVSFDLHDERAEQLPRSRKRHRNPL